MPSTGLGEVGTHKQHRHHDPNKGRAAPAAQCLLPLSLPPPAPPHYLRLSGPQDLEPDHIFSGCHVLCVFSSSLMALRLHSIDKHPCAPSVCQAQFRSGQRELCPRGADTLVQKMDHVQPVCSVRSVDDKCCDEGKLVRRVTGVCGYEWPGCSFG